MRSNLFPLTLSASHFLPGSGLKTIDSLGLVATYRFN